VSEVSFDTLTFSCSSTRWIRPYGDVINELLGSFGANEKALVTDTFDGATRTGIQLEGSRTNTAQFNNALENWSQVAIGVNADSSETTDPAGNNESEELVPNTSEASHYLSQPAGEATDGITYAASVFIKSGGYDGAIRIVLDEKHCRTRWDLSELSVLSELNIVHSGIEDSGDSWRDCWMTYLPVGTTSSAGERINVTVGDEESFIGDGTNSTYNYSAQVEAGHFHTSPIPNPADSSTARSADNAYWAEVDVDSNLRGLITVYVIPEFSSAMLYEEDGKHTVLHFDDATQDYQIYFEQGATSDTGRIVVYGASAVLTSGDHTWSRGQLLKLVIDPTSGEITTSLFTTGNDTHSGSSWSTDDGDVYLGQKNDNTEQFFGIIFEPEYEGGAEPAAALNNAMIYSRPF